MLFVLCLLGLCARLFICALWSPAGDLQLIIAIYPMSQKLRGAPRLLFGNGCF